MFLLHILQKKLRLFLDSCNYHIHSDNFSDAYCGNVRYNQERNTRQRLLLKF